MRPAWRWTAAIAVIAALAAGCAKAPSEEHEESEPARLEAIAGTDLSRVILTQRAAERLDIQTADVAMKGNETVVPTGAVVYDETGAEWVYTNPGPLVFVRQAVRVIRFDGDIAFLSEGPPAGTKVVTVGVAELFGFESGVE
jgi:hypothetical protein